MFAHAALAFASLASLAAAQGADLPPSLSSEIIAIFPTETTQAPSAYFADNPAAASTFVNEFSSIVVNNPTYFPSAASFFGVEATPTPAQGGGSGSGSGGRPGPGATASLYSVIDGFIPAGASASPSMYFEDHPGQYSTFVLEVSSVIVNNPTVFPSLASELAGGVGGVGGGSGPTTEIFRSIESTATRSTATNAAVTPQPHFGGGGTTSSQSSSTSPNFAIAQPTPMLGLGLSGAAVAGFAGIAALL